jgi:hypothetical protein
MEAWVMLIAFVVSLLVLGAVVVVFLILMKRMNSESQQRLTVSWKDAAAAQKESWTTMCAERELLSQERKQYLEALTKQEGWISSLANEVMTHSKISDNAMTALANKLVHDAAKQMDDAAKAAATGAVEFTKQTEARKTSRSRSTGT